MKRRRVILILGKVGSGKSYLAKRIVRHFPRVIVFDPLEEYHGGLVFTTFLSFADYVRDRLPGSFFIVLRFRGDTLEETERMYDYACRVVWHIRDCLLVAEEAEQFLNSYDRTGFLNYLIAFGRHRNISILGIGRRPTEIAIKLRAQFTSTFCFRQTEPADLAYLYQWGFDQTALPALGLYEFATVGEPIEVIERGEIYDPSNHVENAPANMGQEAEGVQLRVREQDIPDGAAGQDHGAASVPDV